MQSESSIFSFTARKSQKVVQEFRASPLLWSKLQGALRELGSQLIMRAWIARVSRILCVCSIRSWHELYLSLRSSQLLKTSPSILLEQLNLRTMSIPLDFEIHVLCGPPTSHHLRSESGVTSLPEGALTVERISDLVGRSRLINTIDVTTQSEGPIYTMQEWVEYFASPSPRKPLLNVVSLDLANTALQAMVSAPDVVKELDLVDKAWPASVTPSPKVQLYTLMSGAGCFMDFHIDFGGSSVWYHVLSGRKVFLVIPPTRGNLMAFEEWASSDRQVRSHRLRSVLLQQVLCLLHISYRQRSRDPHRLQVMFLHTGV
ncbi:hypothetical protein Mapa_011191 [Marchantia paleacea]|nr:hypothetical protein Mapa_011191 [Marchantia paleacea]